MGCHDFDLMDSNSHSTPTSTHPHPHTPSKQPVAHNFIFSLLSSLLYSTKSPSSFSDRSIYFPFLLQWEGCGPTFALTIMISYFNYCCYWIIGLFNLKEYFLVLVLWCFLWSPGVPRPCLCLPETSNLLKRRRLEPGGEVGDMSRVFSRSHPFKPIIKWLILLLLPTIGFASTEPDVEVEALTDLLTALKDSSGRITDWNANFVSPCFSWSHITCRNGNVISLSLASNGFSGTLSPSITKLKYLASLDFQNNNLTGLLPVYLANLTHLQNLNLANNNFRGPIPNAWGQLSNLKHLDLSSNELTGRIPMQFFTIPNFNFTGSHLDCGSSLKQPCVSGSSLRASNRKSKLGTVITSASCSVSVILLIGALFAYRYYRMHKLKYDVFVDVAGEDECKISFGQLKRFSWREIQLATDNFDESNIIGQGGFGRVYKGVLLNDVHVAVKRLTDYNSPGGEAAFLREVQLISVAVHRNLLRLIGFCTTPSERILVYPFMKNLSVAYRLRDLKPGEKGLDWSTRKHIAFGAAHGLEYLHDHCNPKIIHRDLKAANILLDDKFEPVLGDFGLAKLVDTKSTHVTTQVRGTMGHIAPEYLSTGKSSEKTDVFGYGITLLELVTGQRAIDLARLEEEEDVLLLDHIKKLLRENRLDDIVDRNMKMHDPKEVETVIQVALLCTQSSPEDRPKMAEVVRLLQGVDLAERWTEWEQLEGVRNREFSLLSHQFAWAEESTHDQEAIQLSKAR